MVPLFKRLDRVFDEAAVPYSMDSVPLLKHALQAVGIPLESVTRDLVSEARAWHRQEMSRLHLSAEQTHAAD
jgi:hypothetical protein